MWSSAWDSCFAQGCAVYGQHWQGRSVRWNRWCHGPAARSEHLWAVELFQTNQTSPVCWMPASCWSTQLFACTVLSGLGLLGERSSICVLQLCRIQCASQETCFKSTHLTRAKSLLEVLLVGLPTLIYLHGKVIHYVSSDYFVMFWDFHTP